MFYNAIQINGKRDSFHFDFDDDGFNFMLCVEPGVCIEGARLGPGETWRGEQMIHVSEVML